MQLKLNWKIGTHMMSYFRSKKYKENKSKLRSCFLYRMGFEILNDKDPVKDSKRILVNITAYFIKDNNFALTKSLYIFFIKLVNPNQYNHYVT